MIRFSSVVAVLVVTAGVSFCARAENNGARVLRNDHRGKI
jgi:hypothetical protein